MSVPALTVIVGNPRPLDIEDACAEYLSWLQVEANKAPTTVLAFTYELRRFHDFLEDTGHSLRLDALTQQDLRAFQLHLAMLPGQKGPRLAPGSRARALTAVRSCLRWLAREGLIDKDLWSRITVPKVPERLPKPIDPYELPRLLAGVGNSSAWEPMRGRRRSGLAGEVGLRDRALVHFLISTGCRISEALALDRTDIQPEGERLVVRGKGNKERSVYLTTDAQEALADYLKARCDFSPALFINYDRTIHDDRLRRLTTSGAHHAIRQISKKLGITSFTSPHVARHTTATNLLEATGGDVRLVQEILGHANLNTLAGYTKVIDARKGDAYRLYQEHLNKQKQEAGLI
jgi:integrase/recombinase XerD